MTDTVHIVVQNIIRIAGSRVVLVIGDRDDVVGFRKLFNGRLQRGAWRTRHCRELLEQHLALVLRIHGHSRYTHKCSDT